MNRNAFSCTDGKMAFFVPFTFSKEDSFWDDCFEEEKLRSNEAKDRQKAYLEGKEAVMELFKEKSESLFNNLQVCLSNCQLSTIRYDGAKHLCSCMSITTKFHDDASQKALRTELSLSKHKVVYEKVSDSGSYSFSFDLDVYLSINKEDNICFLILRTGLDTIENNGILKCSTGSDVSDKVIFWKHIFYKDRLKVKVDGSLPTSLRQWATEYLKKVHIALKIDPTPNIDPENGIYFSYSIVELDDVKADDVKAGDVKEDKGQELISLKNIDDFMQNYSHQLYGLLVSDEGWKYVPDKYIEGKFKDRYHSSRDHIYSFFIGQNALVINQKCEKYQKFGEGWFEKYSQSSETFSYCDYFKAEPCIPGLKNHLFPIFMKSIYKNIMLDRIMNDNDGGTSIKDLENKIAKLTDALESHSVLLGETQSIKDCVHKEFGLSEKWRKINERYTHKINSLNTKNDRKQNNRIDTLTRFTIALALLSLIFSLTDPDPYTILKFTRDCAPRIAVLAVVATFIVANERIRDGIVNGVKNGFETIVRCVRRIIRRVKRKIRQKRRK